MSTAMADERKVRDVSVLKIAADMIEEAGFQEQAEGLRAFAKSEERGLPGIIEIHGRRWFQRTYGNTYHTVSVSVDGEGVFTSEKTYGYGDAYRDTAWEWLGENGYLGTNWKDEDGRRVTPWQWAEENGVKVDYAAEDVKRERDL